MGGAGGVAVPRCTVLYTPTNEPRADLQPSASDIRCAWLAWIGGREGRREEEGEGRQRMLLTIRQDTVASSQQSGYSSPQAYTVRSVEAQQTSASQDSRLWR
jgi:hypothetical protein